MLEFSSENRNRPFKYSFLFLMVTFFDIVISFLMCLIFVNTHYDVTSGLYNEKITGYFVIILLMNIALDIILINNMIKSKNYIEIELCWIKSLFGFLGIFTIISGLYFFIISLNVVKRSYVQLSVDQPSTDRQLTYTSYYIPPVTSATTFTNREKTLEIARFEKTEENIKKLRESGEILYIKNYVIKYHNYLRGTKEFNNLRDLLDTKKFHFSDEELESIIHEYSKIQAYAEIKRKIFHNNPKNSDDVIRNYLELIEKPDNTNNKLFIKGVLTEEFDYRGELEEDIDRVKKVIELKHFELDLLSETSTGNKITIKDIDSMSGYDFENILKQLFIKMGYKVIRTNLSNDQGADLIIEKFGERIVIQAKNWENNVGNTGIQEIVAAIKFYNAHKARVISSSGFTSSAISLARSNNVELWDRDKLILILNQNPIFLQ